MCERIFMTSVSLSLHQNSPLSKGDGNWEYFKQLNEGKVQEDGELLSFSALWVRQVSLQENLLPLIVCDTTGQTLWILILIPRDKPSMDYFKNQSMLKIYSCKEPPPGEAAVSNILEDKSLQWSTIKSAQEQTFRDVPAEEGEMLHDGIFPVSCAPLGYSMAGKAKGKLVLPKPCLGRSRG